VLMNFRDMEQERRLGMCLLDLSDRGPRIG
jgi:hypothetical protein